MQFFDILIYHFFTHSWTGKVSLHAYTLLNYKPSIFIPKTYNSNLVWVKMVGTFSQLSCIHYIWTIYIFFIRLGTLDLKTELGQSYFNRMEQICYLNVLEEQFTYVSGIINLFLLVDFKMFEHTLISSCCHFVTLTTSTINICQYDTFSYSGVLWISHVVFWPVSNIDAFSVSNASG